MGYESHIPAVLTSLSTGSVDIVQSIISSQRGYHLSGSEPYRVVILMGVKKTLDIIGGFYVLRWRPGPIII